MLRATRSTLQVRLELSLPRRLRRWHGFHFRKTWARLPPKFDPRAISTIGDRSKNLCPIGDPRVFSELAPVPAWQLLRPRRGRVSLRRDRETICENTRTALVATKFLVRVASAVEVFATSVIVYFLLDGIVAVALICVEEVDEEGLGPVWIAHHVSAPAVLAGDDRLG